MTRYLLTGFAVALLGLTGCRHNCCGTSSTGLFNRTPSCSPTNATPVSYPGAMNGPVTGYPASSYGGIVGRPAGVTAIPTSMVPTVPYAPFNPGVADNAAELPFPSPAIPPTHLPVGMAPPVNNPTIRSAGIPK